MNKLFAIFLFILSPLLAKAQFSENIVSGRPGQSNGPFGVGKSVFQFQSGISFNVREIESKDFDYKTENTIINQSTVFRYGLFEKTELRASYGLHLSEKFKYKERTFSSERTDAGFNAFAVGLRQNLIKQNGFIPAIGVQLTALLGGLDIYRTNNTIYQSKLLLQHKIFENFVLNTNLIYEFNPEIENKELDFVFSFNYRTNSKISIVAEFYGTYDKDETDLIPGKTDLLVDVGLSYLVNKDLALDIFGGYDNTEYVFGDLTRYFVSAGVSYRVHKRD